MTRKLLAALTAAASAFAGLSLCMATSASAAPSIPFTDQNSSGWMTLCGRNDEPVTSGSLLTVPFVWKTVAASPAPSGYDRAYLAVFQPIQYVDPGDWTGTTLTSDAIFFDPDHPAVQATNADQPLYGFSNSAPPHWDGLYELRMYYSAVGKAFYSARYPSAVIQVSGEQWKLLTPDPTPCSAGNAVSEEDYVLPKSELDTERTLSVDTKPAGAPLKPGQKPQVVKPTPLPTTPTTIPTRVASPNFAVSSTGAEGGHGSNTGEIAAVSVGGLLIIGGAVTGLLYRRRRKNLAAKPT